jgi:hypothetical protein
MSRKNYYYQIWNNAVVPVIVTFTFIFIGQGLYTSTFNYMVGVPEIGLGIYIFWIGLIIEKEVVRLEYRG